MVSGPLVLQTEDFAKIHDITLLSILLFFKCHYLWDYLYCCYNCNFKYLNLSSMFNPMSSGIFSFLFLAALLFLPPFLSSTSTPHPWWTLLSHCCCCCWVTLVISNSVWPHRQRPTMLFCPWGSPGKNTGVGCHFLLQSVTVHEFVLQA